MPTFLIISLFKNRQSLNLNSKLKLLFFAIGLLLLNNTLVAKIIARDTILINDNWKFIRQGTTDAMTTEYNDAHWQKINIPHCFNVTDPYDNDNDYYRGIVTYRKKIILPDSLKGKSITLFFEGANQSSDVFVNGIFAGSHKGGYTAFSFPIDQFLVWGRKENVITVQLSNAVDMSFPPLHVGFTSYGGIYRSVKLIVTNQSIHFATNDHGSQGVFINTPKVNKSAAVIEIKGSIQHNGNTNDSINIVTYLKNKLGNQVAVFNKNIVLNKSETTDFSIQSSDIIQPELWSPEQPNLYHAEIQIIQNNKVVDVINIPLAFRWFAFNANTGFMLNGEKYILKGTNRHQDKLGMGSALSNEDHLKDLLLIKKMGCNFLRLAHYPQADKVLQYADELGLLIWEEIPLVDYMNLNDVFLQNCKTMITEMVKQHYNHPSVILWGSMNEIFLHSNSNERAQKITDSVYAEGVRKYAVILDSTIRKLDATRYSTMAMHMSSDYDKYQIDKIPQVASFNIYNGWYSGLVNEFGPIFDRKHQAKPNQTLFISEYGAESDDRVNTENPTRLDNTGQYQRYFHESYLAQIQARPYLAGTAIWNEFDFGNPNIGGTQSNINHKGMCTWDRIPKDVFYFYKANWNPEPMIYIASRDWKIRAGKLKDSSTIDVYSNSGNVSLQVNETKYPSLNCNSVGKASWKVQLKNGLNKVAAYATNNKMLMDTFNIYHTAYSDILSDKNFKSIAINLGSNAQYIDSTGLIWVEDKPYTNGSFGYVGGTPTFVGLKNKITNTNKTPLLYTYINGIEEYRMDVLDGKYEIEIYLLEPEFKKAGLRIFDVSVNDQLVLNHTDLFAEFGFAKAVKKIIHANAKGGNGIRIKYKSIVGKPISNGIRLIKN
jgi:beta-galactosidase